jgi:hypothetical protein
MGREHFIAAELAPLRHTEKWFGQLKSVWELRLAALNQLLVLARFSHRQLDFD